MSPDCQRWADVADRHAVEEPLTADERHFLETHPDRCPACASERAWWGSLATLQTPDEDDRDPLAVVPEAEATPKQAGKPSGRRRAVVALAVAAAAAVGWFGRPGPMTSSARVSEGLLPSKATAWPVRDPAPKGRWHAVAATGDGTAAVEAMAETRDVVTGRFGHVCFRHDLGVVVCAGPTTRAILHGHDDHPWVALTEGQVVVELESRDLDAAFFVQTPNERATALGTMFAVEAGRASTALRVTHGRVAWGTAGDDASRVIAAGEAVDEGRRRVLSSEEMEADRWLLRGALMWKGGPSATIRIEPPEDECRPVVDGRRFGAEGVWLRLPVGAATLSWQQCAGRPAQTLQLSPGQRVSVEETSADAVEDKAGPSTWLARAQAAQAQGRLQAAAVLYTQLVTRFPRSAEASVARLARGRLLLQQGKAEEALLAFDAYLAQGGGLGQEARLGRIQALGALGRDAERAAAVTDFIARYPDSKAARALKPGPDAP